MRRHVISMAMLMGTAAAMPALAQDGPDAVVEGTTPFTQDVLIEGLEGPWELTWGPDDHLWVTERTAGRVTRINPETGEESPAITIDEVSAPGGQDGLLGMALHPELLQGTGNDYVYVGYTYVDEDEDPDPTVTDPDSPYRNLYTKIVQLTYNEDDNSLSDPVDLITGMPASNDHNSGRMKIGPDGKLYYTIGDQGNNQLANYCIPIESQRLPTEEEIDDEDYVSYVGKSLRLDLDGSIPDDNPEIEGVVSHVYTYGHRNMQGIDFGPDGTLYASEHGPKTDDEINILHAGENYGWPHVVGYQDDMAFQYARWADADVPCEDLEFSDIEIAPSVPRADESEWDEDFVEPIATMFTVPSDYDFVDPVCEGINFICWPTAAPSSLEYYGHDAIPGWENSLVVPALKRGSIYHLSLSEDGTSVEGPITRYFQSENRFRDSAVSPDGTTIYVATDPGGLAEALEGGITRTMQNPGAILVFTYEGEGGNGEEMDGPESDQENGPGNETGNETGDETGDESEVQDDASATDGNTMQPQFTAEQAEAGNTSYDSNCATCHGTNLTNGTFGTPLAGDYFENNWFGETVADLVAYSHTMPPSAPGSLPDQTYRNIVAYILQENGHEAGDEELPADEEALERMSIGG